MEVEITNSTDEETVSCDMLMLKSEALIHLHQPLEALQTLNRYWTLLLKMFKFCLLVSFRPSTSSVVDNA